MYGWLWRALPGPAVLRAAIVVVLVALVVTACFQWVFPAVAPHVPFNDGTVGSGGAGSPGGGSEG